jgi:RimJ/RimL family protein N-acetyltransferase
VAPPHPQAGRYPVDSGIRGFGMISTMTVSTFSFADKPTLTGALVTLRPVSVADVAGARELVDDPQARRLTGTHGQFSDEQLERWYATREEHDDRLDLAIVERATDRYVGEVVLADLDPDNRSCSFRICLVGPRAFGRGLGTEATRLVLGHAFDRVGLHRVDLEVYAFNPRARHVYEKVGFVGEGTKREALLWEGVWIDAHVMAMLDVEWARHHGYP